MDQGVCPSFSTVERISVSVTYHVHRSPIMFRPEVNEFLFTYIAVAFHMVSLVLIQVDSDI